MAGIHPDQPGVTLRTLCWMAEARRLEDWKQITWLRAGWTMKPADAATLNEWNPLIGSAGGGGRVPVDADFNRAMGAALEAEAAKGT